MIDAHRIVYNNLSSDEFDVIPGLSFSGDDGATASFLGKDGVYTEHYNGHHTIHRAKYNEVFTPRFTLIKKDYSDFDATENRRILSWLTSSEKPGWLEVYKDDSNVLEWKVFGCITSVEQYKLGNGRIIGYEFEIESSHPYAFSRKMETTKQIVGPTTFNITSNSDEYNKPIYPTVTIKFGDEIYIPVKYQALHMFLADNISGNKMIPNIIYAVYLSTNDSKLLGYCINLPSVSYKGLISVGFTTPELADYDTYYCVDGRTVVKKANDEEWETVAEVHAAIKIENTTSNISTLITGAVQGETIILDGTNKVISAYTEVDGSLVQENKIFGNNFNFEWPLLNYGENNITITGNCSVTFEWLEPRKVGDM